MIPNGSRTIGMIWHITADAGWTATSREDLWGLTHDTRWEPFDLYDLTDKDAHGMYCI